MARPTMNPNEVKFLAEIAKAEKSAIQIIEDARLAVASYNPDSSETLKQYRQRCLDRALHFLHLAFSEAEDAVKFGKDMPTGAVEENKP